MIGQSTTKLRRKSGVMVKLRCLINHSPSLLNKEKESCYFYFVHRDSAISKIILGLIKIQFEPICIFIN